MDNDGHVGYTKSSQNQLIHVDTYILVSCYIYGHNVNISLELECFSDL